MLSNTAEEDGLIVVVGGEKGGVGKSTFAVNIAVMRMLSKKHDEVLLLDTSGQSTVSYFCAERERRNVPPRIANVHKQGGEIRGELQAFSNKYKDIIVDAGGYDSPELRASLLVAQKAVFPIQPSQFDLYTIEKLNQIVETAKLINPELVAMVVLNRASTNPKSNRASAARELIGEYEQLTVLENYVCERVVYSDSVKVGRVIAEYKPRNKMAIYEMQNLYEDIYHEAVKI